MTMPTPTREAAKPSFVDFIALLPGASRLNEQIARELYSRVTNFTYRKAEERDPAGHVAEKCRGVGFQEIKFHGNLGTVLISKELKRAYIFDASADESKYAENYAKILMILAGWGESPSIEYRDRPSGGQAIPYYQLGKEIEKEHQNAIQVMSLKDREVTLHFLDELSTHYELMTELHQKSAYNAAKLGEDGDADIQSDYARLAFHINFNLKECKKASIELLNMPKAKPENYLQAWEILTGIMKEKGIKISAIGLNIPERQQASAPEQPEDALGAHATDKPSFEQLRQKITERMRQARPSVIILGHETDETPESEAAQESPAFATSTPIDPVVESITPANTALYPDDITDAMRFVSSRLKEGAQQAFITALRDLKYLRNAGITRVGYRPDAPDQQLLENIAKLKTVVEDNPEAVPPAGTEEYETFLENALKREVIERQTTHATIELPHEAQAEPLAVSETAPQLVTPTIVPMPPIAEPSQPEVPVAADSTAPESLAHAPDAPASLPEVPQSTIPSADSPEPLQPELPVAEPHVPESSAQIPVAPSGKRTVKEVLWDWHNAARSALSHYRQAATRKVSTLTAKGNEHWKAVTQRAQSAKAGAQNIVANARRRGQGAITVLRDWKSQASSLCSRAVAWGKRNGWELAFGGVAGAATRIAAQFALASSVAVTPAWAVVGSAVLAGALAGGSSSLARATWRQYHGIKSNERYWAAKAFLRGMPMGALGGIIGAGVTNWLFSHDLLPDGLGHHVSAAPHEVTLSTLQVPSAPTGSAVSLVEPAATKTVVLPPAAPDTPTSLPVPDAPPTPRTAVPPAVEPPQPAAPEAVTPAAPVENISADPKVLLNSSQMNGLPKWVQGLAAAKNPTPAQLTSFCQEASYHLMNGSQPDRTTAAALMKHGIKAAQDADMGGKTVRMLHANYAYMLRWGIGVKQDIAGSVVHAKLAGDVINNFAERLFRTVPRSVLTIG
ncbi:MAG: hypothetical protein ABTQ34_09690 [Bdellovibrionales bacterium]